MSMTLVTVEVLRVILPGRCRHRVLSLVRRTRIIYHEVSQGPESEMKSPTAVLLTLRRRQVRQNTFRSLADATSAWTLPLGLTSSFLPPTS